MLARRCDVTSEALIELQEVHKHFPVSRGFLSKAAKGWIRAVDGVTLTMTKGQTYGLVGESGCGKTTVAKLILRIETPTSGTILFAGQNVHKLQGAELRKYRETVQVVFQDPFSSLNPRMRIWEIIEEPLRADPEYTPQRRKERIQKLLNVIGFPTKTAGLYPHQFSGGQRQRIAIARALAPSPSFIVLDEPVSSLDVSIRAQIMNLLKDLQHEFNLTYMLISHDLAGVRYLADNIGVMYLGAIVESGPAPAVYGNPLHPYTQALLSNAMPSHPRDPRKEVLLPGEVPSPINIPPGCRFHPRCPKVLSQCSHMVPQFQEIEDGHWVACHLHSRATPQPVAEGSPAASVDPPHRNT